MLEHIELFFKSIFVDNMVFAYFLGMCSYLAVSKKVSTAVGLGAAVIFVLTVTVPLNWFLDQYILQPGALAWLDGNRETPELSAYADYDLSFLSFILFIATIATMVQLVEIIVEKFSPSLYNSLGIFLPLIAVNCAILGGSLFMQYCINKDPPKMAQFTAIKGKKIPNELYNDGENFSTIISTNCTIVAMVAINKIKDKKLKS